LFKPKLKALTRIHPYKNKFAYDTEKELASWMKRPMRNFEEDHPFYPWLPPEPTVNFHLNFKE